MKSQLRNIYTYLLLFSVMIGAFMLMRIVFYIYNHALFDGINGHELLMILLCGLRVDLSTLCYVNLILVFFFNIPFPFRHQTWYWIFLMILFIIFNGIAVFINIGDIFYFPFNGKRITTASFELWPEFVKLLPSLMKEYWYGVLFVILLIAGAGYIFIKINKENKRPGKFRYPLQGLIWILTFSLTLLGGRGSIGRKPLLPITVMQYINVKNAPIATNSVFTIIHSYQKTSIKELNYFSKQELTSHYTLERQYQNDEKKINVVVIILESFSREFVGFFNDTTGYTPFLDSLAKHSLVCTNAFADAERSIKGVAAVVAGMPNLMEEDIYSSIYQTDCVHGLGYFAKQMGYHTSFFHGGTNGTMGFDVFTKTIGFDEYYGRSEFGDDKFYDGTWGIWDEEFFQYFGNKINSFKEPFCSVIFSVSSHHPYALPTKYKESFSKGKEEITATISYADMALRKLFGKISKEKWFKNTLFVITADHSFPTGQNNFYNSTVGRYAIPVMFYFNGKNTGSYDSLMQQHDILPSILDYIGYKNKFYAFGRSIFSAHTDNYCYFQLNNIFCILNSDFVLLFDEKAGSLGLFDYRKDKELKNNLSDSLPDKRIMLENMIKAILQTHNDAVINNKLCLEKTGQ